MRVFRPSIREEGNDVIVSARVEVTSARSKLPDELWFAFPRAYRRWTAGDLNGFAIALLPLAMTLGEDLCLDGVLSPRLSRGLQEYQRVQCAWRPTSFKPVCIEAAQLQAAELATADGKVVSSFSGGVDSSYTLWRHLAENEPNHRYRISHCLMINGFDADSDIGDRGHFSKIQQSMEPMLASLGVQLVVCRTNYMSFSDTDILKRSFGAMVTAPAMILGAMISSFFIPASYRFDEFFRDGSHLMIDHLLATESLETVHDSSHLARPEKTMVVSGWEATYSTLRVCFNAVGYQEDPGLFVNCSRCEKCIRTMKTLEIAGMLEHYTTFTGKPSHLDVWLCYYGDKGARLHAREIMSLAWTARRPGVWLDYSIAIAVSLVIKIPRTLLQRLHLALEARSELYATRVRKMFPRLRRRARWIK
jgi:hypothetical protein